MFNKQTIVVNDPDYFHEYVVEVGVSTDNDTNEVHTQIGSICTKAGQDIGPLLFKRKERKRVKLLIEKEVYNRIIHFVKRRRI